MKVKIDLFVAAIIVVIFIAYIFPQFGSSESELPIDLIASIGISLIFFFYGLKLSSRQILFGLKNWKLHLLIQLSTFVLFPLIVMIFYPLIQSDKGEMIWLSFLFLAALPSTVSSSVVMVSIARGDIPSAIFNASISGLIGIVITPLWIGLFLQETVSNFDLGDIYLKLLTEILVPVVLGVLLQRFWGNFARKYGKQMSLFDKSIILLIIYKSFAESFEQKIFTAVGLIDLALISLATIVLFYVVYFITGYLSRKLKFNKEDQITAQFCGTKKSLVHGTVFSKILFPDSFPAGIILLPLMMFHAFQILIISVVAGRLAKR